MSSRTVGSRLADPSRAISPGRAVRRRLRPTQDDHPAVVVVKLLALAGAGLAWLLARFPRTSLTLLAGLVLVSRAGWLLPSLAAVVLLAAGLVWRLAHPSSYRVVVGLRVRAWRRRWFRYAPRWAHLMARHELTLADGDSLVWPGLRRVRCTEFRDSLLVKLRDGQHPGDIEKITGSLAHALGSPDVRTRVHSPGRVWVDVLRRDPLATPIPALPVPAAGEVDLSAAAVGRHEHGGLWTLPLLGTHILAAGATGSGKGSLIWSVLRYLAPAIHAGLVLVWAIDPKGGMELYPGRSLFDRYEDEDTPSMVRLLEDAAEFTRDRSRRLKTVGVRKLTPTATEPMLLVVADEFAYVTAYCTNKRLVERADAAVQTLCSQGRAPAVVLMVALQDPAKEIIPYRNLFPTRVALRLDEPHQADMVLGDGARQRGAYCDQIPMGMPGTAYVKADGVREPARVRAAYPTDTDIAALARDYPAAPSVPAGGVPLARQRTESGLDVVADIPAYLTDDELTPEWKTFVAGHDARHPDGVGPATA